MSLQGKSQMKITLSWIIVNLTEFLLIPWVSLQPGLSFGLSAWVFLGFILNFAYLIMWPPRPLCPPPLELFQKFSRFGDATCPFLTDLVPGDFHWYHISLLFFLGGHYECLQATYSDPYLIFSFTIFSSWHQEPCSLSRTPTWSATTRGALGYLTRTKSSTNSATLTSNSSLSSRTPAWSSWGIFGRSRSTPVGRSAMSSWPTRPCRSPSLSWDRSNSSSENQRQEYGSTLASSPSKQFFSCDFSNFTFLKQIFHKQNIFMTMIFGIFCHVISQVSGHSENHSTYKTFQVLGPLLPIFNAHHGRDPRLETDAVRAHDRYL